MKTLFMNKSNDVIVLYIDNVFYKIPICNELIIDFKGGTNVSFFAGLEKESEKKDGKIFFSLESYYKYNPNCKLDEDELFFEILCEDAKVGENIEIRRVVIKSNMSNCIPYKYIVKGRRFKRLLKKNLIFNYMIKGPLVHLPGLCVLFFILGIFLTFLLDWKIVLVYFFGAYMLVVLSYMGICKATSIFFSKVFNFNDEEQEIYKILKCKSIDKYF